ncbi:MAG: PEP-CTERM sorting domain-containing protein [Noviherbaspirillum sp.]
MFIKPLLAAAVLAIASPIALANTLTSDACAPGQRDFSVTADAVVACLAAGAGNINGNNQGDASLLNAGWVYVDTSNGPGGAHDGWLSVTTSSGQAGSFSINSSAYATYDRIAIGFKSGNGQMDPDWAIFELADNTMGGTWAISSQALSHAILYGFGTPPVQVPEPGTLGLMGLGFLAALGLRRRRKQGEAAAL